jgi:hypothetical protein
MLLHPDFPCHQLSNCPRLCPLFLIGKVSFEIPGIYNGEAYLYIPLTSLAPDSLPTPPPSQDASPT